jgi:SAM-dependent methyltransferase
MKIDKVLRKVIPSAAKLTYNPIFKHLVNAVDFVPRRIFREFSNIPPNHLRIRVGVGNRFLANHIFYLNEGRDFWVHAIHSGLCRLDSNVLDIGCGCGRFAQHLRDYKFKQEIFSGRYVGIDIDEECLNWCRQNFDSERFSFHRSNHVSKAYNVAGKGEDSYVLPIANESIDFVFSTSLFTHLLEPEMVNYYLSYARSLERSGRS